VDSAAAVHHSPLQLRHAQVSLLLERSATVQHLTSTSVVLQLLRVLLQHEMLAVTDTLLHFTTAPGACETAYTFVSCAAALLLQAVASERYTRIGF
jgi:hypothetical protein